MKDIETKSKENNFGRFNPKRVERDIDKACSKLNDSPSIPHIDIVLQSQAEVKYALTVMELYFGYAVSSNFETDKKDFLLRVFRKQ